jgi:ABC-type transport system involved in multi-copper enzyme maturation permease subunit
MNDLVNGIQAEILKTRRTRIYYGLFILQVAYAFLLFLTSDATDTLENIIDNNNLLRSLNIQYSFYILSLLPLLVGVITSFVTNSEYKNNTLKLIYTLPFQRFNIYISKIFMAVILIIYSILLECLILLLVFFYISENTNIVYLYDIITIIQFIGSAIIVIVSLIPIIMFHVFLGFILNSKVINIIVCVLIFLITSFTFYKTGLEMIYIPHSLPLLLFKEIAGKVDVIGINSIEIIGLSILYTIVLFFLLQHYFNNYSKVKV